MTIKLGIVMDPIQSINIKKDTGFAMLIEAQYRGYELYYMEMNDLYLSDGEAYASTSLLQVKEDQQHWFDLQMKNDTLLSDLDVILMRKDPPFDMEYIYATYILEHAERSGVLVINKPKALRDANEKLFTTWFEKYIPPTLVTRQMKKIRAFISEYKDIILKPLDGMGGESIFRLQQNDPNFSVIIEILTKNETAYTIVQAYLPQISQGDKRIFIVNGETIPYCLARIPAQGETRGNIVAGGKGVAMPVTAGEMNVAKTIAPVLKERGLIFVGVDMIGEKITEINVTAPTCVKEIEVVYKANILGKLFDAIEAFIK